MNFRGNFRVGENTVVSQEVQAKQLSVQRLSIKLSSKLPGRLGLAPVSTFSLMGLFLGSFEILLVGFQQQFVPVNLTFFMNGTTVLMIFDHLLQDILRYT